MAVTMVFDVVNPTVEIVHDPGSHGSTCRMLKIISADGNRIDFHFDKVEDIAAFVGLQVMATGVNLDALTKS